MRSAAPAPGESRLPVGCSNKKKDGRAFAKRPGTRPGQYRGVTLRLCP